MNQYIAHPTHNRFRDLTGYKSGFLTVLGLVGFKWRNAVWECQCTCGNRVDVKAGQIVSGKTQSCGCYKRRRASETHKKHGGASLRDKKQTPAYNAWCNMKTRCLNRRRKCYARYGGRGISICERWVNDFTAFLADMGEPPHGYSLDRIDTNGNYEPTNCRWATCQQQASNTRRNRFVSIDGERMTAKQAAKKYGVSEYTIYGRLNRGKVNEEAVFGDRS